MKKPLAIASLALVAALSLSACGKNAAVDNSAVTIDNGTTDVTADEGNSLDATTPGDANAALSNSDDGLTENSAELANTQ